MGKIRLDELLCVRGFAPDEKSAQAIIMSGIVFLGEQRVATAGFKLDENAELDVRGRSPKYVSRGGFKLEKALDAFHIDLTDKIAMDAGASTGGFTDCMLQHGAKKVYAVDVGYGQLAWSMRNDPRVVCMERTNVRYLTNEHVPQWLDFISIDVSFISLKTVLPPLRALMRETGEIACLVKPQFEAEKEKVGKKGVVRDPAVHREVLEQFLRNADACGFAVKNMTFSPIRGPEGNIEYLGHLMQGAGNDWTGDLDALVRESHATLEGGKG
ncbi:MAG: TlyA family RNA methyltransferase [Oscillospiraceae bacterium]